MVTGQVSMKEQLVQLIIAFGAAHASGNALLKQLAAQQMDAFLAGVVVKLNPAVEETE